MNYFTTPCDNCPFRSDRAFPLAEGRVDEIEASLVRAEFPCHKTTEFDDHGERIEGAKERHCAGALILLEKLERPSQMMRISERLGLYDRRKLDMDALVYDSFEDMADACEAAAVVEQTKEQEP